MLKTMKNFFKKIQQIRKKNLFSLKFMKSFIEALIT